MLHLLGVFAILGALSTTLPAPTANFASSGQAKSQFHARLSTVPIDLAMATKIAGHGTLRATLAGNTLTISGEFDGLKGPATMARIHVGPKGIRGPAVLDLKVSNATEGSITGSVELTPQQLEDLKSSRLYVQLHSESAPEGNLWGWLLPVEGKR